MTEAAAVTEYTIRVPVWTEKMIAAWAKSLGWQPTVLDADGNSIANPVEPIYACLSAALTTGSSQAVHQISQEAAESARVAAIEESATMMQAILAATMAASCLAVFLHNARHSRNVPYTAYYELPKTSIRHVWSGANPQRGANQSHLAPLCGFAEDPTNPPEQPWASGGEELEWPRYTKSV